jgi:RNA polymerase sigma-70 factor (ECF subfamily)
MTKQDRGRIASDAASMRAMAGGEEAALRRVMADLTPTLARFAGTLAASADIEDVLQEAFLRLWRAAPDWRPEARISTFLHTIVYRLCVDRLRRRRRLAESTDEAWLDLPDDQPDPEQRLLSADRRERIERALAALPPRQRAAMSLCYGEDLTQAEAAATLGCTQEAYEALLGRARRALRAALAEDV